MTISNYDGWKLSFFYSVTSEKAIQKLVHYLILMVGKLFT
ncbi:hypothetical protein SA58113_1397 [Staphylococcus argenteus]|nr:hypothetical protein SA58113_1397 [Staphylococcus argenteus]